MPIPSDESLMLAVATGDREAFEQLVLRHQQTVWRTAYRMVGDRQIAEDLAQEGFLRVVQAADRYQPTAAFRTYLYRIIVRLCLDSLRKKRPESIANLNHIAGNSDSVAGQAEREEQADRVQQVLASIPPKQRSAIVLRYYEGLSGREIAATMDTTTKAVERLLARGRKALRARLSGLLEGMPTD